MKDLILVIDAGTTSTRAIVFDQSFQLVSSAQKEVLLTYPQIGWVEQDGLEIWSKTLEVCRACLSEAGGVERIAGIGITNQRETTLVWDRETGTPIAPAIIWQDRRTAPDCDALKDQGLEAQVQTETGLLLDPYFSGTKLRWLLDHIEGAQEAALKGNLAFGTVDTWLIWKLTKGRVHATDTTNASRTLLYPLTLERDGHWSAELADVLKVPLSMLPKIHPSSADYGETAPGWFGAALPIVSVVGDQQAALVGQGCLTEGSAKITLGTGAFLVANTGANRPRSAHKLLGTVGYTMSNAHAAYALEGSIFNAGTVINWLRDGLGLIQNATESERQAATLPDNHGIYFVPAFTGLGAPHWDADARGAIVGLSRGTRAQHIVRAGLEAVAYQTQDLLSAFKADGAPVSMLRVDGGMAKNDWLLQFMANICNIPVERPDFTEMTALGAAALGAIELGWISAEDWANQQRRRKRFDPTLSKSDRAALLAGWSDAVRRTGSAF